MKSFILLILISTSLQLFASEKVIYGEDNRVDVVDCDNPLYVDLAHSTAAQITSSNITKDGDRYKIDGSSLAFEYRVCKDERYASQKTVANCSGFLVKDDLLVTAGHCIKTMNDCRRRHWVFGYYADESGQTVTTLPKENIYRCTEIISQTLDSGTKNDFALIRLDRAVVGRNPLQVRTSGKIKKGTELVIIGHPLGLPAKIADNAFVRSNIKQKYFAANLDSFGGNSGSAVINIETGLVEGILVRGERDFIYDSSTRCNRMKRCSNNGCKGEDVTRITNISKLMEILR